MKKLLYSTVTLAALFAVAAPVLADDWKVENRPDTKPSGSVNIGAEDVKESAEGEGRLEIVDGKPIYVIPRENGYDAIELPVGEYTGKDPITGEPVVRKDVKVPASVAEGPAVEDSKETKESKSTDAAVKSAVEAAKKDAAKKDGAKKLPNTAAVK
ncbi:hypothetical protein [Streptococcus sp. NLN76]|uniref:hypothetical protein n=1 Tax=Streptococcus sp. NLN76 TaxID=2822800 RepID=UPI0018AA10BA|nr:hypothetical protein [Streptococcus sp. NLN76]MBF8970678.1 hypothetical protein [Streptococcus sp. NLN76]